MKNYMIEKDLASQTPPLKWKPERLHVLEELIKETVDFGLALRKEFRLPSLLDYGNEIKECIQGTYDLQKAKSWVFLHLYRHACNQANAIGILIEASCVPTPYQLWRTLYEAYVVCEFLASFCKENSQIFRDYIVHDFLRSWIRWQESVNKAYKDQGKDPYYPEGEVQSNHQIYKASLSSFAPYIWAKPVLGKQHTLKDIMEKLEDDMAIFYGFTTQEVHPTLGDRFVLPDLTLPLEPVFILNGEGSLSREKMDLKYITAKVLTRLTRRTPDFLNLNQDRLGCWERLCQLGRAAVDRLGTIQTVETPKNLAACTPDSDQCSNSA